MTTEYENSTAALATSVPSQMVARREITVNNTKVHITSIFSDKTSLDNALKNIVSRKLTDRSN